MFDLVDVSGSLARWLLRQLEFDLWQMRLAASRRLAIREKYRTSRSRAP